MSGIVIRKAESEDARRLADIAYRAWENGILPLLTERPGMQTPPLFGATARRDDALLVIDVPVDQGPPDKFGLILVEIK